MGYKIGSFNLRDFNFSNTVDDERIQRDISKIAQIIDEENFDVIALQEINAEIALKYLVNILNRIKSPLKEYAYCYGTDMPRAERGAKDPERFGFIWNSKRLRLVKPSRGSNPSYYQNREWKNVIRPPYYARFTARGMIGGSNFELRLINIHICFGDILERANELNVMLKQVLPRISDITDISADGEIMPTYTILLGDYNLTMPHITSYYGLAFLAGSVTHSDYTGRDRAYKVVQTEATTTKKPSDHFEPLTTEQCYANDYDHFSFKKKKKKKLHLKAMRVNALEKYFTEFSKPIDKLKSYREKVSDHVPISLELNLR